MTSKFIYVNFVNLNFRRYMFIGYQLFNDLIARLSINLLWRFKMKNLFFLDIFDFLLIRF